MDNLHDFSKCLVDFTKCPPEVKLRDFHPIISAFSEFKDIEDDNFIKISIATADPESPFVKIKERDLMLISLFEFLGIDVISDDEKKFYQSVLDYQHPQVLGCFSAYLKACHDIDWTEYQTTKQTYDVLVNEAGRPREKDESIDNFVRRRLNIQNHLKTIGVDLKKIEAKIFPDSRAAREISLFEHKKIMTFAEKYSESNTHI